MDSLKAVLPEVPYRESVWTWAAGRAASPPFSHRLSTARSSAWSLRRPCSPSLVRKTCPNVEWKQGSAEEHPAGKWVGRAGLHVAGVPPPQSSPQEALQEIHRVLTPGGSLVIRNGTAENNEETEWLHCFPEALAFDAAADTDAPRALEATVCRQPFDLDHPADIPAVVRSIVPGLLRKSGSARAVLAHRHQRRGIRARHGAVQETGWTSSRPTSRSMSRWTCSFSAGTGARPDVMACRDETGGAGTKPRPYAAPPCRLP